MLSIEIEINKISDVSLEVFMLFDKEAIKGIKIIPVSDAFSILEHTLVKSIIPLNLTESQLKNNQNTKSRGCL